MPVMLAQGNETIFVQGKGFSNTKDYRCALRSESGSELTACSVAASFVNSSYLRCVTGSCSPTTQHIILYLPSIYIPAPNSTSPYILNAPVQTLAIASSWTRLAHSDPAADLAGGSSFLQIHGYGFDVGSLAHNCSFYQGTVLQTSSRALQLSSNLLRCHIPR